MEEAGNFSSERDEISNQDCENQIVFYGSDVCIHWTKY